MDTLSIFILVIGVFSVLTNGILLIILYLDPLKKFRATTDYLIISLTISDFITGAVACGFAFKEIAASPITFGFFWATILSSFFVIFFLSCERLVIVMYPLKVKLFITKRRVRLFIAGNWLLSIVLGCLIGSLVGRPREYLQLSLYFVILILILVLVGIYSVIIWKTKQRPDVLRDSLRTRSQRVIQQQRKLTGVLLLLVSVLVVTVVPYVAVMVVFCGYRIFSSPANIPKLFVTFSVYYFPIELLNFAVNPIIYAWRLPNYRNSLFFYLAKLPFLEKRIPFQSSRSFTCDSMTITRSRQSEKSFDNVDV